MKHFWQLSCSKRSQSACCCGAKQNFEDKTHKTHQAESTFGSSDVQKVHGASVQKMFKSTPCPDHFWRLRHRKSARNCGAKMREAQFEVKMVKNTTFSHHFWMFKHRFPWQAQWILHLAKSEANVCVLQQFQKRWLKRVCKDAFRMAGAVQEISPSSDMLRGQGADLLRRDGFWSIRFSGYFREMARKNAKRIRTRPSALHSAFHF